MTVLVRNFVSCEDIDDGEFFTLQNVRFCWPAPPSHAEFWLDVLNPSEREISTRLELYRARAMVDYTEEELVVPGMSAVEMAFRLETGNLRPKSYTVIAVVNGVAAGKLSLDFGAPDG